MSAAVDHLGADKLVLVLCRFEDATGRIRHIDFNWATSVITIELVQGDDLKKIVLHHPQSKTIGPRSGNLRDYFEVTGIELVWEPDDEPAISLISQQDPEPVLVEETTRVGMDEFWKYMNRLERAGQMEEVEKQIKDRVPYAHYALEIDTVYRSRWHRFKAAGDLVRAEEARKKAADWAYIFAGFATSGGEGAAFSYERDQFLSTLK